MLRWFATGLLLAAGLGAWLLWTGQIAVPPQYDPRTPLDLAAPKTFVTPWKMARLRQDRALCTAALESAGLSSQPVPDRAGEGGCGLENAVRVMRGTSVAFSSSFLASCPLAVAWAMFERDTLQPAARTYFDQPVRRVSHLGSYACRDVRGGDNLSQHATANALDVSAFTLADGRTVELQRHWKTDGKEAAFLRALQHGACKAFNVVFGPDRDRNHANHFHLDMGRYRACR